MYFWLVVIGVAVVFGLFIAWGEVKGPPLLPPEAGWVYFLSPFGGAVEDPPAPIKIGMTHRNPLEERLPEIETMSPKPLEVLYTLRTDRPEALERKIHDDLQPFRRHGEWFDRDATLAYIDAKFGV